MKIKLFNRKKTKSQDNKLTRITNRTIEQHRREILNSAKKFKYPVQYEKYRLVINAIIISIISVLIFAGVVAWRLYKADDTSLFMYKVTQIIPARVGKIDSQPILFSDYLAYFRSSWNYHQTKEQKLENQQAEDKLRSKYQQQAFQNAAKIAYAKKIAREKNITVSRQEIEQELQQKLTYNNTKISLNSFDTIVKDYYGLTRDEYFKIFLEYPILLKKVVTEIDQKARQIEQQVRNIIKTLPDKAELATLKDKIKHLDVEFSDSGVIKYKINDSGRSEVATKLEVGKIAPTYVSRNLDSYNIIQLISKTEDSFRYQMLKIPLTEFENRLKPILSSKVTKYIQIKD